MSLASSLFFFFFNDTRPRIRGFNSTCQPLTGHLLYANALDVQRPAEGTWAPGALSLAEERGHVALTPADRDEY